MSDSPIYDNLSSEPKKPDLKPQPKVIAATSGSVVGGAVGTIVVYVIETLASIDIPSGVEGAIIVVAGAVLAFAAGYIKKN